MISSQGWMVGTNHQNLTIWVSLLWTSTNHFKKNTYLNHLQYLLWFDRIISSHVERVEPTHRTRQFQCTKFNWLPMNFNEPLQEEYLPQPPAIPSLIQPVRFLLTRLNGWNQDLELDHFDVLNSKSSLWNLTNHFKKHTYLNNLQYLL